MDNKFEVEVLTRLAVIESKIDDYKTIKEKSEQAFVTSSENKIEIEKIEDRNKWLWRTTIGSVITGFVGIVILLIRLGIGAG